MSAITRPVFGEIQVSATLVICLGLLVVVVGCADSNSRTEIPAAPNVILIIGDGMDDQQITIARNYLVGNGGQLLVDSLPYRGTVQVQAVREENPGEANYVADSASTATAMAGGVITSRTRIGTTAQTDVDIVSVMEIAQSAGVHTGIVTTASVTDATPASFIAHINQRWCHDPESMVKQNPTLPSSSTDCSVDFKANGGRGSISEQIAVSKLNILLGGGAKYFANLTEGSAEMTVIEDAQLHGFSTIIDGAGLASIQPGQRVLGLFSPSTMPVRYRGENDGKGEFLERVDGKIVWPEYFACEDNPDFQMVPTLGDMTQTALLHLDNDKGFMLMIESASIDKEAHERRPCGHIGEVEQLMDALQQALMFRESHPNTLILVTADHGHSTQLIPDISGLAELHYGSPGRFARVRTPEGGVMGINYASNDSPLWDEHSGVQVPLYAIGPGVGEWPIYVRQTDIHDIVLRHLGLAEHEIR